MLRLVVLVVSIPLALSLNYNYMVTPMRMELCKHNTWLYRHHIVYNCNFSNLSDPNEAQRDITPFACDPTDGANTKLRKRLLFLGEERRADDGFIYECALNQKTRAVSYRAKGCWVDEEHFHPGHFIKGAHNTVFLCYKDLDNIVRMRVRHPAHQACSPVGDDPRCRQGIAQMIFNSDYGYGEPFAYNPSSGESLTVAIPPLAFGTVNLSDDVPQLSSVDLLRSIQGSFDPSTAHQGPRGSSKIQVARHTTIPTSEHPIIVPLK